MRILGSQMELHSLLKKYVTLFTSLKFNKPSANHDIQRQECHTSLNSLVSMVNQKPFLSSIFLSENLSKDFFVLVSTIYSPENLYSSTSELLIMLGLWKV